MSNSGGSVKWDPIREIASGDITSSYQVFGGVFLRDALRIWPTNDTNGDLYLSVDGITDMIKMPSMTARAADNKTNDMYIKSGTQFYIRYDVTPDSPTGWATLEVEYA